MFPPTATSTDTDTGTEPRLPPELERAIFELAAADDAQMILRLVLVARRVRAW
jgi:hypothetical protein